MSGAVLSANFVFLKRFDPQLVRLGTLAERYFKDDPCTCLIKLRQYGELLAQLTAAKAGLYEDAQENQVDLLRRLRDRRVVQGEVYQLFQELRVHGNRATHDMVGDHRTALENLKYARALAACRRNPIISDEAVQSPEVKGKADQRPLPLHGG